MKTEVDNILDFFLRDQLREALQLEAESDLLKLDFDREDPAPQRYVACFRAKTLIQTNRGEIVEAEGFDVGISMGNDHLRRVNPVEILTYLGPHARPWHPNLFACRPTPICVSIRPGMGLVDILHVVYDVFTWNLFNTGDEGLNHPASQWARHQDPSRFPIDRRPLKWRREEERQG